MSTLMSNYPNGFSNGILIRGVPLLQTHPGKVFWVLKAAGVSIAGQKTGSDGNQGTFNDPFATLDYAIGQCSADRGDIIVIKPGHTETISTATAMAWDVAGVAIIGLGSGSLRPTFTLDTAATATITVSAANISVNNVLFVANFADIATFFTLTTAKDFTVENCEFRDTSAILNAINVVDTNATANAADGLWFSGNRVISKGTTAATSVFDVDAALDRMVVNNNFYTGGVVNNTPAWIDAGANAITNLEMGRNKTYRINTDTATGGLLFAGSSTGNTGMVYENYSRHGDVAAAIYVTAGALLGMAENYGTGDADTQGTLIPAAGNDAA